MYLITGGLGFIGFNFVKLCLKKKIKFVVLDAGTYAANDKIKFLKASSVKFYKTRIGNKGKVTKILQKYQIKAIINFAAETHVDNSISNPSIFIKTNIIEFYNLLQTSKIFFNKLSKNDKKNFRFLNISTDETFGSLRSNEKKFTEKSKFYPNNPYSASKSAGDLIARAWCKTFDLPIITTNCSNNYGRYQNIEKLIPKIITNALSNLAIPIYGDGKNTRDWIHVEDHCLAIYKIVRSGKVGQTYNIGGSNEIQNIKLAKLICKILDNIYPKKDKSSYTTQIKFVSDRKAHDHRYAINSKKIKTELNWRTKIKFNEGIKDTVQFYMNHLIKKI